MAPVNGCSRLRLSHTISKPDRPDTARAKPDRPDKARAKSMPVRVTRCHSLKDSTNLMTVQRAASEGSLHTAEETSRPTEGLLDEDASANSKDNAEETPRPTEGHLRLMRKRKSSDDPDSERHDV